MRRLISDPSRVSRRGHLEVRKVPCGTLSEAEVLRCNPEGPRRSGWEAPLGPVGAARGQRACGEGENMVPLQGRAYASLGG